MEEPVCVTVSALDAGHITLPERLFVTDADPNKASTVPSLSFLIQHPSVPPWRPEAGVTNLVFDLGVKRDLTGYTPEQQIHVAQRQPIIMSPDCADSLRGPGGNAKPLLDPARDVDLVILSHVHWDHVGTPSDFERASFAVGSGTLHLLKHGAGPIYPAELFNDDELPASRTVEFPPVPRDTANSGHANNDYETNPHVPKHTLTPADTEAKLPPSAEQWAWKPLGTSFPHALDFFGDGSVYVVDSPGHLYGHVNVLARVGAGRYIYLGGDCCHDSRILSGEKGIALYDDGRGGTRSVHVHTETARRTLDVLGEFMKKREGAGLGEVEVEVEVVLAHDGRWRERNGHRFWPGRL